MESGKRLRETVLRPCHEELGARMVDFGGWNMPLQYKGGIVQEHLATRKVAGFFDVSHMGRFAFAGNGALNFLQRVLSSNAAALEVGESQYTLIPTANGGALDDAYLYRFVRGEYLLVVNASNAAADWDYLAATVRGFGGVEMRDRTDELAMISLQGPLSREILSVLSGSSCLPGPRRNTLGAVTVGKAPILVARTGYTGEPLGFELFVVRDEAVALWDSLAGQGAQPVGLGARDTLRLEACLPLYGHELGIDPEGNDIPVFASSPSRFAVSFSPLKEEFVGKAPLLRQFNARKRILQADYSSKCDLPRIIRPVAVTGRGVARAGARIFRGNAHVGYVTSGTTVPYWKIVGEGIEARPSDEKATRAICLALLDSNLREGDEVEIEVRDRNVAAVIVPYHARSETPPFVRAIIRDAVPSKAIQYQVC